MSCWSVLQINIPRTACKHGCSTSPETVLHSSPGQAQRPSAPSVSRKPYVASLSSRQQTPPANMALPTLPKIYNVYYVAIIATLGGML